MNPEIKAEWVAALRSGEYRQGKGALRSVGDDGLHEYCCLGVLCDLYSRKGEGKWEGELFYFGPKDLYGLGHVGNGVLPSALRQETGLPSVNPMPKGERFTLAELNDTNLSFPRIAKLIEDGF